MTEDPIIKSEKSDIVEVVQNGFDRALHNKVIIDVSSPRKENTGHTHHHHLLKNVMAKLRNIERTENALFKLVKSIKAGNEKIIENQENIWNLVNVD